MRNAVQFLKYSKHAMADSERLRTKAPRSSPVSTTTVELCYIDLSSLDDNVQTDGNDCWNRLVRLLGHYQIRPAQDLLVPSISSSASPDSGIPHEIQKYVKLQDRYLALASFLLKSRIFFRVYPQVARPQTLVELPRTDHGKPYIPTPSMETTEGASSLSSNDTILFSLSHQWPFVGLAAIIDSEGSGLADALPITSQQNHSSTGKRSLHHCSTTRTDRLCVGFDTVVFDPPNPRLYRTVEDFVNVFQDSFTTREWEAFRAVQPTTTTDDFLREFYVQWAVKEAYTKALGVGLGFDFSTFDVQWGSAQTQATACLWTLIKNFHETYRGDPKVLNSVVTYTVRIKRWGRGNLNCGSFTFNHYSAKEMSVEWLVRAWARLVTMETSFR